MVVKKKKKKRPVVNFSTERDPFAAGLPHLNKLWLHHVTHLDMINITVKLCTVLNPAARADGEPHDCVASITTFKHPDLIFLMSGLLDTILLPASTSDGSDPTSIGNAAVKYRPHSNQLQPDQFDSCMWYTIQVHLTLSHLKSFH